MPNLDLKSLKDFLLSFELMSSISLGTGFLLFLPEAIIKKIYLLEIREEYGTLVGIIFVLSSTIVLVRIFSLFVKKIKNKYDQKRELKYLEKNLKKLNGKEKEIIEEIFKSEHNTALFPISSGVVRKLETLNIICKTVSNHMTSPLHPTFPYSLQPWAYDYIEKKANFFN